MYGLGESPVRSTRHILYILAQLAHFLLEEKEFDTIKRRVDRKKKRVRTNNQRKKEESSDNYTHTVYTFLTCLNELITK